MDPESPIGRRSDLGGGGEASPKHFHTQMVYEMRFSFPAAMCSENPFAWRRLIRSCQVALRRSVSMGIRAPGPNIGSDLPRLREKGRRHISPWHNAEPGFGS